jgi:hypothetical protein
MNKNKALKKLGWDEELIDIFLSAPVFDGIASNFETKFDPAFNDSTNLVIDSLQEKREDNGFIY